MLKKHTRHTALDTHLSVLIISFFLFSCCPVDQFYWLHCTAPTAIHQIRVYLPAVDHRRVSGFSTTTAWLDKNNDEVVLARYTILHIRWYLFLAGQLHECCARCLCLLGCVPATLSSDMFWYLSSPACLPTPDVPTDLNTQARLLPSICTSMHTQLAKLNYAPASWLLT